MDQRLLLINNRTIYAENPSTGERVILFRTSISKEVLTDEEIISDIQNRPEKYENKYIGWTIKIE